MSIRHLQGEQPSSDEPYVARKYPGVSLALVVVLLALLGLLYFWSKPLPPDATSPHPAAGGSSKAMQLALPQAPGLSSASRAFSPSSALMSLSESGSGAGQADDSAPEETLLKVGRLLSPEWGLAVTLLMNETAGAPASDAASRPSTAAPTIAGAPAAAGDAASTGSIPQVAEAAQPNAPVPQVSTTEPQPFSREAVHPGITRRVYVAPSEQAPQSLAAQVAECSTQGSIAGETCRQRVCRAHWGKDPACPLIDVQVLP